MLDFTQARRNMVDTQIHTNGVITTGILAAFETTPRELFAPEDKKSIAYFDEDLIVKDQLVLIEPMIHAKMLEAAKPNANDFVLDIGCAHGYSSAILSPLVTTVLALDNDQNRLDNAVNTWNEINTCNIVPLYGSLAEGAPSKSPFDMIFINGSVAEIPENIVSQLKVDGRMICIVKKAGEVMGVATLIQHNGNGAYSTYSLFNAGTAYLEEFEPKPRFVF